MPIKKFKVLAKRDYAGIISKGDILTGCYWDWKAVDYNTKSIHIFELEHIYKPNSYDIRLFKILE